jgi:hypothetical protein
MFIILLRKYSQTKIKTLGYFIFAFFLFVLQDILPVFFDATKIGVFWTTSYLTFSYGFKAFGFYLILLYLAAFRTEHPFSRWNVLFGSIIIANISMMAILSILGLPFENEFFPNVTMFTMDYKNLNPVGSAILFYYLMNFLMVVLQIFFEFIWILHLIRTQIKTTQSQKLKMILVKMKRATYVILGGLSMSLITDYSTVVFVFGLILFFIPFITNGILIFQEANLHRLMIVSKIGCPQYSHIFHPFEGKTQTKDAINTEGMLFSGAIQAITTLLTEIMGQGEHQRVKEIVLNNVFLLIAHTPNYNQFVILMVQKSTSFVQTILDLFNTRLGEFLKNHPIDEYIEGDLKTQVDNLIAHYFGVN